MPKISRIFRLGKSQRELDFVDIDPNKDTPVYLNPFTFSVRQDPFSVDAFRTITSFFQHNLTLIQSGNLAPARKNFLHLNEPNETCLGQSKGKPKGKGMGSINTDELFESIAGSTAVQSGLLEDLADTAIFIPNIGRDKVSDMTTNIIRLNLIKYTQNQCRLLGIDLTRDTPSGFYWDAVNHRWSEVFTEMLIVNGRRILFVPKGVVSYVKEYSYSKYHRHYALTFLQEDNLRRNTPLVRRTYNEDGSIKREYVTKKSLTESSLPEEKIPLAEFTERHPEIFRDFKQKTAAKIKPLENSEFETISEDELIDHMISKLSSLPSGTLTAPDYHALMVGVLEYIFYPNLINPTKELEINEGRKRIDISFDNASQEGSFFRIAQDNFQIPCRYIYLECKNYSTDIRNPELDQMNGRFSVNTGKLGIILCRSFEDEPLFLRRCSDIWVAQNNLIIPLTDADIIETLRKKKLGIHNYMDTILADKARLIINS